MNPKICMFPFTSMSVSPRGAIRPCCMYNSPDMPTWENVKDLTSKVPWPSKSIKILQEKMLGGRIEESTPLCNSCWEPENAGLDSHRLRYQRSLALPNEELIKTPKLTFLDLQFGYLCNLSCIMCHPEESSQVQKTIFKLIDNTSNTEQKKFYQSKVNLYDNHDWTVDENSYQKVLELCQSVKSVKISGGEPFFNPKFKSFLEFLLSKKVPIEYLHVTTNLTIYDKDIVELLNRFVNVRFRFSLESIGKEDDFIRWPSRWEEKQENLHAYLSQLRTKNIVSSTCIQSLNLFSFSNTIKFLKNLHYNINIQQQIAENSLAGLYYSDKQYIDYYLKNNEANFISKYLETIVTHINSPSLQVNYFLDMAKLQNKNIQNEFPIWHEFHSKYIRDSNSM